MNEVKITFDCSELTEPMYIRLYSEERYLNRELLGPKRKNTVHICLKEEETLYFEFEDKDKEGINSGIAGFVLGHLEGMLHCLFSANRGFIKEKYISFCYRLKVVHEVKVKSSKNLYLVYKRETNANPIVFFKSISGMEDCLVKVNFASYNFIKDYIKYNLSLICITLLILCLGLFFFSGKGGLILGGCMIVLSTINFVRAIIGSLIEFILFYKRGFSLKYYINT